MSPRAGTDAGIDQGYAMAALLASMSVMCVMLSVALPVWRTVMQREREAELIFRGQQYAHAIALFQRKYAGTFPPSVEALVEGRFLRRRYLDPMTNNEFRLLYADVPYAAAAARSAPTTTADPRRGIVGVVSRSSTASLRSYEGRWRYDEWTFVATQDIPACDLDGPRETRPRGVPTR
jgi:type II secretory pathway pseudopilin PulG